MGIAVAYCILYDVNTNKYCAKAYSIFCIITYSIVHIPKNVILETQDMRQNKTKL